MAWHRLPGWLLFLVFLPAPIFAIAWLRQSHGLPTIPFRARVCLAALPIWQFAVFLLTLIGWLGAAKLLTLLGTLTAFFVGLAWVIRHVDLRAHELQMQRALVPGSSPRAHALEAMGGDLKTEHPRSIWDPCDLEAWYYGRNSNKFKQSLTTFAGYGLMFLLLLTLITWLGGCSELYEMPAGGGKEAQLQQVVKIQKVIKKKFVINPLSSVIFKQRPIDEVKLQLLELTDHTYKVGQGEGSGAGFSGGTHRGKVRFIRLEYSGGDWDQDFGRGADLNILIEYGVRTSQKVAAMTESRKVAQLKNFPKGKSPPMVYMTGQKSINLSGSEIKILRQYLLDKHGMIFADNGGSSGWHGAFFNLMRNVLPEVQPIRVPLDHPVHQRPYPIPFLPYVAPHGGKDAYGWVVNGRLVTYYHPGDIGDAWSDGHAGVKREIYELCYQLGVNIIFYAHAEYNKWLAGQKKDG